MGCGSCRLYSWPTTPSDVHKTSGRAGFQAFPGRAWEREKIVHVDQWPTPKISNSANRLDVFLAQRDKNLGGGEDSTAA